MLHPYKFDGDKKAGTHNSCVREGIRIPDQPAIARRELPRPVLTTRSLIATDLNHLRLLLELSRINIITDINFKVF